MCPLRPAEGKYASHPLDFRRTKTRPDGLEMAAPVCNQCAALERRIGDVTWMPFFIAGALAAVLAFVPVLLIAPGGDTAQTFDLAQVLAGAAGLAAGIVIGTLVEFLSRLLFAPVYGSLLLKRPLTLLLALNDVECIIGLSARLSGKKDRLVLTIENDGSRRSNIEFGRNHKSDSML
jgi:hypothetical protein